VAEDRGVITLRWGAATDAGRVRAVNEDSFLAEPGLFVIADGMGGHAAGEVASAMAVAPFRELSERQPPEPSMIASALEQANAGIFASADGEVERAMGTTAVGLALVDNGGTSSWLAFNVGDSRLYRLDDRALCQITRDHSLVQEMIDQGTIAQDEAYNHPKRNVVTRALGSEPSVEPDYWVLEPRRGERFLLCSDGLTNELRTEEIETLMRSEREPERLAHALVEAAIAHAGRDNVTVIIIDVGDECQSIDDTLPSAADGDTAPRDGLVAGPSEPLTHDHPSDMIRVVPFPMPEGRVVETNATEFIDGVSPP
jgi:protein phosphatase